MTGMRGAAGLLAALIAATLVATVAAYWGWRWFGPASPPVSQWPAPEIAPTTALALSPPFGAARNGSVAAAPGPSPVATAAGTRLLGVIAERDGGGQALFRLPDGTARLVSAGSRLSDDATLVAVRPDGVTVRDGGGERVIPLRAAGAPAATKLPVAAAARSSACTIPRDYRGAVVRLNAELLQGLIGEPNVIRTVVDAQDGALVVRDETGLAAMLGLRKGDRVTQANGIALRAPEDVVISILRPLAANQSVRVQGTRGADAREFLIVNAGVCPGS